LPLVLSRLLASDNDQLECRCYRCLINTDDRGLLDFDDRPAGSSEDAGHVVNCFGEAWLSVDQSRSDLQPIIDHLREAAQGRDDIRTECAGRIAGGG
jgi:hypothetical protein